MAVAVAEQEQAAQPVGEVVDSVRRSARHHRQPGEWWKANSSEQADIALSEPQTYQLLKVMQVVRFRARNGAQTRWFWRQIVMTHSDAEWQISTFTDNAQRSFFLILTTHSGI